MVVVKYIGIEKLLGSAGDCSSMVHLDLSKT